MTKTLLTLALLAVATTASAEPWKYSGNLNDGGAPANGRYDLRLTLLDAGKAMSVGSPVTLYAVDVHDGAFTVAVDFGVDLANAPAMQLNTEVSKGNSGFVALGEPTRFDPKAALAGVCWDTEGNAGTVPTTNFIGTTDNQPTVIRANNLKVTEFRPVSTAGVNVLVGIGNSIVTPGMVGQSVISGGTENVITSAPYATIAGGYQNSASDTGATVGGGTLNSATGNRSTVAGGFDNHAAGLRSTVGGGSSNCAGGDYSWAGGRVAQIRSGTDPNDGNCSGSSSGDPDGDNGTFVWSDSQALAFNSTGANQFLIRAAGGMAINTNTPIAGAALTVNGNVSVAPSGALNFGSTTRQMINLFEQAPANFGIGVQIGTLYQRVNASGGFAWFQGGSHNDAQNNPGTGGTLRMALDAAGQLQTTTGTIATLSDARLKDQVHDYTGALDQINALRPVSYRYRDAGKAAFQAEGMHLGFIAQEVEQVFPQWVKKGDDGYLMLSLRGFEAVAVRGMQELSARNDKLSEGNAASLQAVRDLKNENAMLRARLDALEAKVMP